MKKILVLIILFLFIEKGYSQAFSVLSPDKRSDISIEVGKDVFWSLTRNNQVILKNVLIDLNIDGDFLGKSSKVISHDEEIRTEETLSVIPQKHEKLYAPYTELILRFAKGYEIHFKVYNNMVAYRFVTDFDKVIKVMNEILEIELLPKTTALLKKDSLYSSYERLYDDLGLHVFSDKDIASLPVMFKTKGSIKVLFSEADLYDYPNLFLQGMGSNKVKAVFPKVVLKTEPDPKNPDRIEILSQEADYIAETNGKRVFPWRFFVVANDDDTFLETDPVFLLSRPTKLKNTSWIKPGKVAWDWYNANNIFGVDFKSGLNTETYKYYIDFASKYGLEYVILDEGWSKSTTEITEFASEMDVLELIRYGKEKGVNIILWCLWGPLDKNLGNILKTYKSWGVAGIKIDFMLRADQDMVNFYTRVAKEAAQNELIVDFHAAFKPSGLHRAYPNVLSYEGVYGAENNKWSDKLTPKHNVTIPFTRMMVGPMDYTPGAMRNAQKDNHQINFNRPVSLGTRAHQVAMYVVYESPLQMLCDTPSSYIKDKHTIEFISKIPTVWDTTIALENSLGEYVSLARKNGNTWYLGAMNGDKNRELILDFSFLPEGKYKISIFKDGINANTYAQDYKVESKSITSSHKEKIYLANGGGWAAIITKQ